MADRLAHAKMAVLDLRGLCMRCTHRIDAVSKQVGVTAFIPSRGHLGPMLADAI